MYELGPDSNCKDLFTTKMFKIAKFNDPHFLSFDRNELLHQVKSILQIQGYLLFQWSIIRLRVENKLKHKRLHFSCSKVMPWNFFVTKSDIELYLKQPKFLWRFSVNNYEYFFSYLSKGNSACILNTSSEKLLTYDEDTSETVPPPYHPLLKRCDLVTYSKKCRKLKYKKLLKGADLYKLYNYEESEWVFTSEYIELSKDHNLATYHEFLDYLILSKIPISE